MPAFYTHYRFGERVLALLDAPLQNFIQTHADAFKIGTQGPDILFYHHPMKKNPIRAYGSALHAESPKDFFTRGGEKVLDTTNPLSKTQAAYLAGVLCHFTLDKYCHPQIDGASSDTLTHGKIESELDKYFLRKDHKPVRGYNQASVLETNEKTVAAIASVLGVTREQAELGIRTMKKINGLFTHKSKLFHAFAHAVLGIAGMERKFGDMFVHGKDDPRCAELLPVLETQFEAAVQKAAALITAYFTALKRGETDTKDEIYRYDYSGNYKGD